MRIKVNKLISGFIRLVFYLLYFILTLGFLKLLMSFDVVDYMAENASFWKVVLWTGVLIIAYRVIRYLLSLIEGLRIYLSRKLFIFLMVDTEWAIGDKITEELLVDLDYYRIKMLGPKYIQKCRIYAMEMVYCLCTTDLISNSVELLDSKINEKLKAREDLTVGFFHREFNDFDKKAVYKEEHLYYIESDQKYKFLVGIRHLTGRKVEVFYLRRLKRGVKLTFENFPTDYAQLNATRASNLFMSLYHVLRDRKARAAHHSFVKEILN